MGTQRSYSFSPHHHHNLLFLLESLVHDKYLGAYYSDICMILIILFEDIRLSH